MSPVFILVSVMCFALGGYCLYSYVKKREVGDVFVALGLFALGILSALLAAVGLTALQSPLAAPLGALTPLFISLGVFKLVLPKWWRWYLIFVVVGLAAISAFRPAVPAIHAVAGLVIVLLPIYAVVKRTMPMHFLGVTAGGVLIGIGGLALASAAMARPILPLEVVAALLPWILLLMVLFYGYGFIMGRR
ncbi:hypothetical protein [Pyrobaculum sp.]|uniref:hypothetical protein n=2 Tax=Pyrobaculum sp. TaxID=2004705 RepID=UPI003173336C